MAASDSVPTTPVRPEGWRILTATERGAAHHAVGLPNQDAVEACEIDGRGVAVAVADGHGHSRHFRSARGARLAVTAACQAVREQTSWLGGLTAAGQIETGISQVLVPAIVDRWRAAVRADIAGQPLTPAEEALAWPGDDLVIAYGTTLLLAVVWGTWLLLAQIGDGDILGIHPNGSALLPVPGDPLLDGHYTTSLCSPWAGESFRAAVVDLSRTDLCGVMLATDGFGNAQAADGWEDAASADLAVLISGHGPEWLAGQLPVWAERCASADGSADDTTIALLLPPPGDRTRGEPGTGAS